jgi:septal ring factor EnvC (AmiA/AmiB activator)
VTVRVTATSGRRTTCRPGAAARGLGRRDRRPWRTAIVVALLLSTMAGGAGDPAIAQQTKRDDRLRVEQQRLVDTQRKLREQREKAAEARKRETSVLAELEATERRLSDKRREVRALDVKVRKTQAELQGVRGDIERLEGQRASQEDRLARRLRAMYRLHAQGGALPVILTTDDPVTRTVTLRQLGRLAALDARMIQEYRLVSDRLGDRRAREEARQQELSTLRTDAQREQLEVDREAAKRRVLLSRVRDERAYHERMVGELTEASRKLEAFVRELQARQRRIAKAPPPQNGIEPPASGFGRLRGRLPWPTEGRIVTTFGAQVHPRFGTRTFRNGIDIEAVEGVDVTAVYGGHVVYTGWFKGYGNLIIVDHGNDYYTLYAHVADILVREGDDVRAGQRIGTVGDTGSLSGARLYFEVRYQGKALDPADWLRQRG